MSPMVYTECNARPMDNFLKPGAYITYDTT